MQLQDVAFADHEIARDHDSVRFALTPDARIFKAFDEIAMHLLGNVQNGTPSSDDIRICEVRFLSRRFCVDPNDIQKIVHNSLELFYLL